MRTEPRPEKVAAVAEVREKFENSSAVVLTEYRGLDVPAMAKLRAAMREAGGEYKIYKNTLALRAVKDLGLTDLEEHFTGPTALAFVTKTADGERGDAVGVAKALSDFAKENDALVIKGGMLDDAVLSPDDVNALAKIPPREELLARLAGGLAAPMQKFASLLQAIPRDFAYALNALIAEGGGPDAAPDAPAAAEEPAAEAADETPEDSAPADDAAATETDAPADDAAADETASADEAPASDAADEESAAPADDATPESEAPAPESTDSEAPAEESTTETETEES